MGLKDKKRTVTEQPKKVIAPEPPKKVIVLKTVKVEPIKKKEVPQVVEKSEPASISQVARVTSPNTTAKETVYGKVALFGSDEQIKLFKEKLKEHNLKIGGVLIQIIKEWNLKN